MSRIKRKACCTTRPKESASVAGNNNKRRKTKDAVALHIGNHTFVTTTKDKQLVSVRKWVVGADNKPMVPKISTKHGDGESDVGVTIVAHVFQQMIGDECIVSCIDSALFAKTAFTARLGDNVVVEVAEVDGVGVMSIHKMHDRIALTKEQWTMMKAARF